VCVLGQDWLDYFNLCLCIKEQDRLQKKHLSDTVVSGNEILGHPVCGEDASVTVMIGLMKAICQPELSVCEFERNKRVSRSSKEAEG
jgi:hypothetical protein